LHSAEEEPIGATLYVVATPIGNLRDISLRALDLLRTVDMIAAEDTRVTRRLLSHFGIGTRTCAVHRHNERESAAALLEILREGRSIALVSDAGTPGVSDPGARVVQAVREAGFRVVPVPGASALTAALCASGLDSTRFCFYGFLPSRGSERKAELARLARFRELMVFYEAPHRVEHTLRDMAAAFGDERRIVIARELTKMFEEIHASRLSEAVGWLGAKPERCRGEFVLMVEGFQGEAADTATAERVLEALLAELPLNRAVKLAAQIGGAKRNALYRRALELQAGAEQTAQARKRTKTGR
jgi:16S rRNA (cytidine1402-2'-O)-methyltransferase